MLYRPTKSWSNVSLFPANYRVRYSDSKMCLHERVHNACHSDFMFCEATFSYFKHFHECSNATVTNIVGHLINTTQGFIYKLDSKQNKTFCL